MQLKKFISKTLLSLFSFTIFFIILSSSLIHFSPFLSAKIFSNHDWLKINERIETSKGKIMGDTIYVGCSVASQLLPYNHNNQLTSNGSTYPIGNYFLIRNAIKNNPDIKTVIYLSVPDVIGHNISRERTYNYFVKPFYTFENKNEILSSKHVNDILRKNRLLDLCLFNSFKLLSLDDYNYSDGNSQFTYSISDEAFEWLSKIDSLCISNDVEFHIASPPVPISKKRKSHNWEEIKSRVRGTRLEPLFADYFKTILYLDDKYLKDHIHWQDSLIKTDRQYFIKSIKEKLSKARTHNNVFKQ